MITFCDASMGGAVTIELVELVVGPMLVVVVLSQLVVDGDAFFAAASSVVASVRADASPSIAADDVVGEKYTTRVLG